MCFRHPGLDVVEDFLEFLDYCCGRFIRTGDLLVVLFTSLAFILLDRVHIVSVLQEEGTNSR